MLLLIKISRTFVLCNLSRPRLGHSLQYETEGPPDSQSSPPAQPGLLHAGLLSEYRCEVETR